MKRKERHTMRTDYPKKDLNPQKEVRSSVGRWALKPKNGQRIEIPQGEEEEKGGQPTGP